MSLSTAQAYFQNRLQVKQPNLLVDPFLSTATRTFLQTVGLPNSEELGFAFDGQLDLMPNGLVRLDFEPLGKILCLDLQRGESVRWADEDDSFLNTSVQQFVECVYEFEYYLQEIQGKEVFGKFYDPTGAIDKRILYANYLTEKIQSVDAAVFTKGYYWPAFIEEIENGL